MLWRQPLKTWEILSRDDFYGWGLIDAKAALMAVEEIDKHFDFGTIFSPVEPGYINITESTLYSADLGYGWNNLSGLLSRDRIVPDNLRRDFVFSSSEHTFSVDLANGNYLVTLSFGDQGFSHDQIDVYAENKLKIADLSTPAGMFQDASFRLSVADGQLNIRIKDTGGLDANWVLSALQIGAAPALPTEVSFDFGSETSPVESGYTQILSSTAYLVNIGYGWETTNGLDSRDRVVPDYLREDFVFDSNEHTFTVDLANNTYYLVTITIGDQYFGHDHIDVYCEDVLNVNDLNVSAGVFKQASFITYLADEHLNLRIIDDGGADANWVINDLIIKQVPALPSMAAFDFGTASSPVEQNWTQVLSSTIYSPAIGYGWSTTNGLESRDRIAPDNLTRDFIFASAEHSFIVDLANGEYLVTVTLGDQSFEHDNIDVYAEATLVADDVYASIGSYKQIVFAVTIADQQLNINILDDGGVDANWVLNALSIFVSPT